MWLNGWIRKIFGHENFHCIILRSNSISYTHVLKRDRLYKWTFVVIIYMKMTQSVWLFFTWKVTLKICIYGIYIHNFLWTLFTAYISKFCTNFGKPLPRVFTNKQNVNKTWNRKIERGNTLSYWVNSSYIIQETSSLKPTFLREMKSIKILLCLNFLLKFFFKIVLMFASCPSQVLRQFKKKKSVKLIFF